MRQLHTFTKPQEAFFFQKILEENGITHNLEQAQNTDWEHPNYSDIAYTFWIIDEDQIDDAHRLLDTFLKEENGKHLFLPNSEDTPPQKKKNSWQPITMAIFFLCTFLFFAVEATKNPSAAKISFASIFASPIQKALLFDYPKAFTYLETYIKKYGAESLEKGNIPKEGQILLDQFKKTPYWKGMYEKTIFFLKEEPQPKPAPLFEKEKQGELFRLITPIFLHGDLLHLFFNMAWLLLLGRQMEKALSKTYFIFFILITALVSNTAQYLMSGANFIGFSGVICAMLFFIHTRLKKNPWEPYQLDKNTWSFILFFLFTMLSIQLLSFFLDLFNYSFYPGNIANTAHFAGALSGFVLAKLK